MPESHQPLLHTVRLTLRPFTLGDAADVQRLAGAREIADTTLNVPHPYADGMAERWIESHAPAFQAGRLAAYAITLRDSTPLIGSVSLGIEPTHSWAELGYWIGQPFWGRGYATEAAGAIVQLGFSTLQLNRVQSRHYARNPASGRVMQKIGMQQEGVLRQAIRKWGQFEDLVLYAVLAEAWHALPPAS